METATRINVRVGGVNRISLRELVFVSWGSDGRVNRIIHQHRMVDPEQNALDYIVSYINPPFHLEEHDVEWCRRDEDYYVNWAGSWSGRVYLYQMVGVRQKFWAAAHMEFVGAECDDSTLTPEEISARGYDRVELDEPPEDLTQTCDEQSCYWCSACEDMLPSNDHCEHQRWCDECGVLLTLEDEPCKHG